jgi:hypothetical protein
VGEEEVELVGPVGADALEDVGEVGEGVEAEGAAGLDEAQEGA